MNTQPNALRLADELCAPIPDYEVPTSLEAAAAAELRRLHEANAELLVGFENLANYLRDTATCNSDAAIASMAHKIIAKHGGAA